MNPTEARTRCNSKGGSWGDREQLGEGGNEFRPVRGVRVRRGWAGEPHADSQEPLET